MSTDVSLVVAVSALAVILIVRALIYAVKALEIVTMTLFEKIEAALAAQAKRIDEFTNELAVEVAAIRQELRDKSKGGLSEAEGQALLVDIEQRLEPIASKLHEIGKVPDPVPVDVETHPAVVAETEAAAAEAAADRHVDPVADPPATDPLEDVVQ